LAPLQPTYYGPNQLTWPNDADVHVRLPCRSKPEIEGSGMVKADFRIGVTACAAELK
jgi:hypothetical protein